MRGIETDNLPKRSWLMWAATVLFVGIVYGSAFLISLLFRWGRG